MPRIIPANSENANLYFQKIAWYQALA